MGDGQPTGAFVEDLMAACRDRLMFYHDCGFGSPENTETIKNLEAGLAQQHHRTRERERQQVEGTHDRRQH